MYCMEATSCSRLPKGEALRRLLLATCSTPPELTSPPRLAVVIAPPLFCHCPLSVGTSVISTFARASPSPAGRCAPPLGAPRAHATKHIPTSCPACSRGVVSCATRRARARRRRRSSSILPSVASPRGLSSKRRRSRMEPTTCRHPRACRPRRRTCTCCGCSRSTPPC